MQLAPRTLAQRYVEEGLRMDEHPLVRFVDGPAGRRARLVGPGGPGHYGMVFTAGNYRRTKGDIGCIVTALEGKLEEVLGESDLANDETWL